MKYLSIALLSLLCLSCGEVEQSSLREQFEEPKGDSRPWTFWYWMYGAVTPEAITADLEAMKEIGLGGAYLMPIRGVDERPEYGGEAQQLTPRFWEMITHAMQEADRLGLQLGMHICDGFALAGGPWITPEESMQQVVWSDTIIESDGLTPLNLTLPLPPMQEGYYADIATYAYPVGKQLEELTIRPKVSVVNLHKSPIKEKDRSKLVNVDDKGVIRSSYACRIMLDYGMPVTVSNVEIILSGNNYQAHRLKVLASDDGQSYREVKQLKPARHGWQNTAYNSTHAIPQTTARYFAFDWDPAGSEPGSEDLDAAKWKPNLKIKEIRLHSAPRIHQYEGKNGLVWRVAEATSINEVTNAMCLKHDEVKVFTLDNGTFTSTLPAGRWHLLRMGHTPTGHTNATAGGGKGLECSKFDAYIVRKQLNGWFNQAFEKTDKSLARRVLKYMHVDSWECGSQNWSSHFADEFKTRRGYDLMPWLPVLAGIPIESAEASERVLRDVRTTIGELVKDVFYQVLAENAKEKNLLFSAECVAPTMMADGLMHYEKVDLPMGEFWLNSPTHDKPNDMLDAISGAHIYGKNIVQAEGFTEVRGVWDEDPAMVKPLADRNFALGINKLFFHVYTHNPWMDRKPGMTLDGIGFFFQRDQIWWNEGRAFVDYIARCQTLLQYGHPVVDIAVFTGEEMPRRSILPERLVPMLPGLYGQERVESERIRLANEGQPLRVRPVGVSHSANMADPEDWVNPLRGYAYDSFNKDALLRLSRGEDGKLCLLGGAEYRVLVLPSARPMDPDGVPLSPEVEQKIEELRSAGVIIPELPYEAADFSVYGLPRDIELPADVAYTHRTGDEYDIYFIANQRNEYRTFTASLRLSEGTPQLWDAVTGEISQPRTWNILDGRMEVVLSLPANGSIFIVVPKHETSQPDNYELQHVDKESTQLSALNAQLGKVSWHVSFTELDTTIVRKSLFDWSKEVDERLKYYSGHAVYECTFDAQSLFDNDSLSGRYFLRLGQLYNLADVTLNGVSCGTAWTSPYEVELTEALRVGENKLQVKVVNTWANALRGADQGKAPYEGIWTNARYRLPGDSLLPSGWLGPVEVVQKSSSK